MKAFEPGQHVVISLPELGRLPARIEETTPGRIVLSLFVRPETPIPWLESKEAEVESVGARGIYSLTGSIEAEGGLRDARVVLRVGADAELTQRRDFVRVDATMPVTVRPEDAPPVDTYATNVSGGGFVLAGPESLVVDQLVAFSLRLRSDEPPVEGSARVVRDGERSAKGCVIEEIDEHGRERLVRFTFDRQREELRRGAKS